MRTTDYIAADVWTASDIVLGIIRTNQASLKVLCPFEECKQRFLEFIDKTPYLSDVAIDIRRVVIPADDDAFDMLNIKQGRYGDAIAEGNEFENLMELFLTKLDRDVPGQRFEDDEYAGVLDPLHHYRW